MASRRPDASFQQCRGQNTGRNPRPPMNIPYQYQRHQSALPTDRFHNNGRPSQGIPLPGTVYAMETPRVTSGPLYNSYSASLAYLPTLQTPPLFPHPYATLPIYTQTLPQYTQVVPNNTVQTVGSINTAGSHHYNQPIHTLQPKSDDKVGGSSSSKDEVEADSYRFGLRGLADVLNGSDSNVNVLAVGRDKETFDLYDNMYCTHNFPWSARVPNPPPQYKLPSCYLHRAPRLNPRHMATLEEDTLFYIFYSTPNDEAQLLAANELYDRGWLYHKNLRVWLIRSGRDEPQIKGNTYEKGSYVSFDPHTWTRVTKENFTLFYKMVEKRPFLPSRKANQL